MWLSTSALLLSLASGQLVMLTLQQEGTLVRRLKVCTGKPAASARWLAAAGNADDWFSLNQNELQGRPLVE